MGLTLTDVFWFFFGFFFMLTVEGYIFTISDVLLKEVSVSHVSVVASVFPGL